MQIEAGKYYKTRDGRKVGPMIRESDGDFMANHPDGGGTISWKPDGVRYKMREPETDLIAEWWGEPKLWKDMTPEEKGALLLAAHEGKVIEYGYSGSDFCRVKPDDGKWVDGYNYRVKPEPYRRQVSLYFGELKQGALVSRVRTDTHRITFDLVDGKPDCNSVKMESL